MASPPEELIVSTTAPALAAKAWGAASGRPLLALHGWLDNAASFDLVAPALAAAGHRVVALDLPGHGLSGHKSADAGYAFIDWAYDVERAVTSLGWSRFQVLGHSMGASIACLYAAVFPQKVVKVAAVEGLSPLTASPAELPERLALNLAARARLASSTKPLSIYSSIDKALMTRIIAGEFPVDTWIDGVVRRGLMSTGGGYSWRSDPRLRLPSAQRLTPDQAEQVLAHIESPVLMVRARQGIPIDAGHFARMTGAVRNLRIIELDGGHHVHLERPVDVATALVEFFAD